MIPLINNLENPVFFKEIIQLQFEAKFILLYYPLETVYGYLPLFSAHFSKVLTIFPLIYSLYLLKCIKKPKLYVSLRDFIQRK